MPLHRKRRIFRSGPFAPPRRAFGRRPTLVAGAAAVLLVGGVALLVRPTALLGRVTAGTGTLDAAPAAVSVIDGATLRLDAQVVRLRGVAAPPRGRACHRPGGAAFDCGAAAADGLARLVRDDVVHCRLQGHDAQGFPQATCTAGGAELNRAVIAAGWARAEPAAPQLAAAEGQARAAGRGLWAVGGF